MSLALDHVIVCVEDLESGAIDFQRAWGLESVTGGRHGGHGTANRIVPLGDSYIELLAVVDPEEAATSAFGRWATQHAAPPTRVDAVCLRSGRIDEIGRRLGLEVVAMSRLRPDGVELSWRLAGLDEALAQSLPFFIEWDIPETDHPGMTPSTHPAGDVVIEGVVISGDVNRLRRWTEGSTGVEVLEGEPAISLRLNTVDGSRTI